MASRAGDAIEVMPGTYREQVVVDKSLSIFGAPGESRPVVEYDGMLDATATIAAAGAGATLRDLDIRGVGMNTTALQANGAVTATDLDLAATGACAVLAAPTPSQLGPGVTATTTGGFPYSCVIAGGNAADVVTGITVRAPDVDGWRRPRPRGELTDATVDAGTALVLQGGGTARRSTLNGTATGLRMTNSSSGRDTGRLMLRTRSVSLGAAAASEQTQAARGDDRQLALSRHAVANHSRLPLFGRFPDLHSCPDGHPAVPRVPPSLRGEGGRSRGRSAGRCRRSRSWRIRRLSRSSPGDLLAAVGV